MLEGHKGHLESDAQDTGSLRVKPVALQVMPDRHGWAVWSRKFPAVKGNRSIGGELTRKEMRLSGNGVGHLEKTKRDCLSSLPGFNAGDHEGRAAPK